MIEYENLGKLNEPFMEEYMASFKDTLEKGRFILGEKVNLFENEFARYLDIKHCIGVASGMDALILSLEALELPENSEVLVPSNTYIVSILSILKAGFKPVLVEPDINTYNIDPELLKNHITPRTSAILVVHLYGKSCKMKDILEFAMQNKLKVIEDCAQSHGARYKEKLSGTFGDIAAFSFYPTKKLGALGDGGAVVTGNDELADKVRKLRNYGSEKKYYNDLIGTNSRLDEIQAGFLLIKLKYLDYIIQHKRALAEIYFNKLDERFILPDKNQDHYDVFHIYNIRTRKRDKLKSFLQEHGIQTEIHYPIAPNHQKAMRGILDYISTPIAEEIHNTIISLPVSYFHTIDNIHYISEIINKFD